MRIFAVLHFFDHLFSAYHPIRYKPFGHMEGALLSRSCNS